MSTIAARERRYRPAIRLAHHTTWFLAPRFPDAFPLTMVMGYPKSGNSWVAQQLADYFQLPLPTLSILPLGFPAVAQSHYAPSRKRNRGFYVIRDGRDVMVSLYHFLSWDIPDGPRPRLNARHRKWFPVMTDKRDVAGNLPAFVERQMRRPVASMGHNWGDHVGAFFAHHSDLLAMIRYERMLEDPHEELSHAVSTVRQEDADPARVAAAVEKYSFERQSGRPRGSESRTSFLRAGRQGDWKNHFNTEAAQVFDDYCGESLVRAGYEPDRSWVGGVASQRSAA